MAKHLVMVCLLVTCAETIPAFAQFHGDYASLPFPIEKAVAAGSAIVRGRVEGVRNATFEQRYTSGRSSTEPVTVLSIRITEVMKGVTKLRVASGQVDVRHMGHTAVAAPIGDASLKVDSQFPAWEIGREYVLFIEPNQAGIPWLWGPQGVFENQGGKVMPPRGWGVGEPRLDGNLTGMPWERFLSEIRLALAKGAGRGPR
jgi:hypothetical protein